MSKYSDKGRADAAEGKNNPPGTALPGIISTNKEIARAEHNKQEYREAQADKLREMAQTDKLREREQADKRREKDKGDGGLCFVTTACVETLGLEDDCHELTVLRRFRDTHLLTSEAGRQAVKHYYLVAPHIVSAVKRSQQPTSEFRYIYETLVCPSVAMIEAKRFTEAFEHYREGIVHLANKYGVSEEA